jgi:hypothetical protein
MSFGHSRTRPTASEFSGATLTRPKATGSGHWSRARPTSRGRRKSKVSSTVFSYMEFVKSYGVGCFMTGVGIPQNTTADKDKAMHSMSPFACGAGQPRHRRVLFGGELAQGTRPGGPHREDLFRGRDLGRSVGHCRGRPDGMSGPPTPPLHATGQKDRDVQGGDVPGRPKRRDRRCCRRGAGRRRPRRRGQPCGPVCATPGLRAR